MKTQELLKDQNEYSWIPEDGSGSHTEPLADRCTIKELIEWLPYADEFVGNIVVKEQTYPNDWAVKATFANEDGEEYDITFRYVAEEED